MVYATMTKVTVESFLELFKERQREMVGGGGGRGKRERERENKVVPWSEPIHNASSFRQKREKKITGVE